MNLEKQNQSNDITPPHLRIHFFRLSYYPLGVGICVVSLLGSAVAPGVISYVLDLPPTPVGGGGSQQ